MGVEGVRSHSSSSSAFFVMLSPPHCRQFFFLFLREILGKFIRNEISPKIWVKNVKFSAVVTRNRGDSDDCCGSTDACGESGHWCIVDFSADFDHDTENQGLQTKYRAFYDYIQSNSPQKYKTPVDIPEDAAQDEEFSSIVTETIGVIVWAISCIILLFHVLYSLPIAVCYFFTSYF